MRYPRALAQRRWRDCCHEKDRKQSSEAQGEQLWLVVRAAQCAEAHHWQRQRYSEAPGGLVERGRPATVPESLGSQRLRYPRELAACGGSPGSATGFESGTFRILAWCLNTRPRGTVAFAFAFVVSCQRSNRGCVTWYWSVVAGRGRPRRRAGRGRGPRKLFGSVVGYGRR